MHSRSSFLKCSATSILCPLEVPHLVKHFIALRVLLNLSLYIIVEFWRSFFSLLMYVFLFLESITAVIFLGWREIKGKAKFIKFLTSDPL